MIEIYFSSIDNSEVLQLPFIPNGINLPDPIVTRGFENINGEVLTLIGGKGLKEFTISTFFPSKRYRWLNYDLPLADECIEFFKRYRLEPLRIVVASQQRTYINMLCTIGDFPLSEKTNEDIAYTLDIKEYIDPTEVK